MQYKILRKIPKKELLGDKKLQKESINKYNLNKEKINFFITCQAGIESLVRKESEKLWLKNTSWQDRIIRGYGNEKTIYSLLINSRFSNRIYLEITNWKTNDFDSLYNIIKSINWRSFLPEWIAIVTETTSIKSKLSHTPSIQSIAKKAIVDNLTQNTWTHHLYEDRRWNEAHIQIFIIDNISYILLDITWNALHKRWYRIEAWNAPIKETLSAALIALSGWKYKENFCDPFCWSGTFAIEAALLARNIAPWLYRKFAIENFSFYNKQLMEEAKTEAKNNIYESWKYKIFASDIDENMIKIAKDNATRAGVLDDIEFRVENFLDKKIDEKFTIVTNPPYWVRLMNDDNNDDIFYEKFLKKMDNKNIYWWFITSYNIFWLTNKQKYKDRKIYNGGLEARFYKKINNT